MHPAGEVYERLGFDGVVGMNSVASGGGVTVYSHAGVEAALRNKEAFSSNNYHGIIGELLGKTIIGMDEPEHIRVRRLAASAFTPTADAELARDRDRPGRGRAPREDGPERRGRPRRRADVPVPVAVIAGMLGLPREDLRLFHRRAVELITHRHQLRPRRCTRRSCCRSTSAT